MHSLCKQGFSLNCSTFHASWSIISPQQAIEEIILHVPLFNL